MGGEPAEGTRGVSLSSTPWISASRPSFLGGPLLASRHSGRTPRGLRGHLLWPDRGKIKGPCSTWEGDGKGARSQPAHEGPRSTPVPARAAALPMPPASPARPVVDGPQAGLGWAGGRKSRRKGVPAAILRLWVLTASGAEGALGKRLRLAATPMPRGGAPGPPHPGHDTFKK